MKESDLPELQIQAIKDAYWSLHDGLDASRLTYDENHVIINDILDTIKNLNKAFPWLDKEYDGN
jgi:hypothetical protein